MIYLVHSYAAIVERPNDVDYPKNLYFTAQLNLEEFEFCYFNNYLPKKGFLYFFIGDYGNTDKVIYSDCDSKKIVRVIREHNILFYPDSLSAIVDFDRFEYINLKLNKL